MAELIVPQVDFSSLGQLPQIYKQAQAEQGLKAALAGGFSNDPQSLAALAGNVAPYNPQLGLSLATLGMNAQQRQAETARQAERDKINDQHWGASFELQKRAANRADEGVPEKAADRAKAAAQYGITPDNPAFKPFVLTGRLPEADASFVNEVNNRKIAAEANGLKPDHPGFQSFILTGKMPREDAQPLTAGDKEAIRVADDAVLSNKAAIDSLNRAKDLSRKAFAGPAAGTRGYAASFLGESSELGKAGIATENMTNEVMTNALSQLKTIFGGNPTEGERKILLEMQGSVSKPDTVRQAIFDRAIGLAQKRLEFNQKRADELRGGSYYKNKQPGATAPGATADEASGVVDWRTYFGGK